MSTKVEKKSKHFYMNQEINKEVVKELMGVKGEARGVVFKTDFEYVLEEKGEEGLRKVEGELERLGYPFRYRNIKAMEFYPVGLRALSLLVIQKVLNFDDEKIKDMGLVATKKSIIVKLFIRFFLSLQRVFFKEAPRIWEKHWTIGKIIPVELNEEKKYGFLRLENFDLHPLYCSAYLRGYFSGILQLLVKSHRITCQETKCTFRGDKYHEYLLKWE